MPCYYPIAAVQPYPGAPLQLFTRQQKHLFRHLAGKHLEVPCNQCSGCRRRQSLQWALRCTHEAKLHKYNAYLTLTYNDKNLPPNNTLYHEHFQLFMKRIRNRLCREVANNGTDDNSSTLLHCSYEAPPHTPTNVKELLQQLNYKPAIKFYMAGEYGEIYGRPHYHALLFGLDFADKTYHGKTKAGEKIYISPTLAKLWPHGYSSIGAVTFASAAYIARYVMKKRTGDGDKQEYNILDLDTGEIIKKKKEYNQMSRAQGIGKQWLDKYHQDVYTSDAIITDTGTKLRPPRYYDKLYKRMDKAHLEQTKRARELEARAHAEDHTPERLAVQETVANAKARFQNRNIGSNT